MSRDPNITVNARLIHAARRWAALSTLEAKTFADSEREVMRRVGELEDAVRAYEKHHGMKPIQIRARPKGDDQPRTE